MAFCNYTAGVLNGNVSRGGANSYIPNTCISVWGTPGDDTVVYTIADVAVDEEINDLKFIEIGVDVNAERARRGYGAQTYTFSAAVDASELNALLNGLSSAGFTLGFAGVGVGTDIDTSDINLTIDQVIAAGAECVCNCNYCTCNCNYCTCNCNYACTCNCNYSDERLKTDIEYLI